MSPLQMRKLMRKLKHRVKLFAEKAMAPHSSTLAWKIPWMKEPDRLRSMGSRSWTRLSDFTFTLHFPALEKEMATHSSVLAWRIPETGEPGGLPSLGLHRVGHDWSDLAVAAAAASCLTKELKAQRWRSWNLKPDAIAQEPMHLTTKAKCPPHS